MSLVIKKETMTNFNAEAFSWSKESINSLIQFYEEQTALWDTSSRNYHKKDARNKAWSIICTQLAMAVTSESIEFVMKKVGNLRTYYNKERSKISNSSRKIARTGEGEIYKSTWAFYDQLDVFLANVTIPRKGPLQMDTSDDETGGDSLDDETDRTDNSVDITEDAVIDHRKAPKRPLITPRLENSVKKKVRNEDRLKEAAPKEVVHQTVEGPIASKQNDAEDIFGKHVTHELRLIENTRARQLAKLQIQKVLFEAQFGNDTHV